MEELTKTIEQDPNLEVLVDIYYETLENRVNTGQVLPEENLAILKELFGLVEELIGERSLKKTFQSFEILKEKYRTYLESIGYTVTPQGHIFYS